MHPGIRWTEDSILHRVKLQRYDGAGQPKFWTRDRMMLADAHLELAPIACLADSLSQMGDRPREEALFSAAALQGPSKRICLSRPCTTYTLD